MTTNYLHSDYDTIEHGDYTAHRSLPNRQIWQVKRDGKNVKGCSIHKLHHGYGSLYVFRNVNATFDTPEAVLQYIATKGWK